MCLNYSKRRDSNGRVVYESVWSRQSSRVRHIPVYEVFRKDHNFLLKMLVDDPAAVLAALHAAGLSKEIPPSQLSLPPVPDMRHQVVGKEAAGKAPATATSTAPNVPVPQQMVRAEPQRGAEQRLAREQKVRAAEVAACEHDWVHARSEKVYNDGPAFYTLHSYKCSKCGHVKSEHEYE